MENNGVKIVEIRKAYYPLIIRISGFSLVVDLIYMAVLAILFFSIESKTLFFTILLLLLLVKFAIQIYFIVRLTIVWTRVYYHIADNLLIKYEGVYNPRETAYPLHKLYSVSSHLGYLGRLLKYGDLLLVFSNPAGENEKLNIWSVVEPTRYQRFFQRYLK